GDPQRRRHLRRERWRYGRMGNHRRRHRCVGDERRRHRRVGYELQRSELPADYLEQPVTVRPSELSWRGLPRAAQIYVALVIAVGTVVVATFIPESFPRPVLFVSLLGLACVTSVWKVNLP